MRINDLCKAIFATALAGSAWGADDGGELPAEVVVAARPETAGLSATGIADYQFDAQAIDLLPQEPRHR